MPPEPVHVQTPVPYSLSAREAGATLVLAGALLALFIFIPVTGKSPSPPEEVTAAQGAVSDPFARVVVEAKAAIVYDLATGETLYAKNADAQLPLASLTKLLTVYAALAELPPDAPITISASAARVESPRGFRAGQAFTLEDLARLTLTASLNDGAAAIAEAAAARLRISQSDLLAGAAAALDLSQTYAVNGSGLDITTAVSGGYGSARDLAWLSGALLFRAPRVAEATTFPFARAKSLGGASFKVANTDPIVTTLPHMLLSKTGYTDLAGGNLSLVFDVGIGHPVAVVVLGSTKSARFTDGVALVHAAIAHFAGVESLRPV